MAAAHGADALGVDAAPTAIAKARGKAAERGSAARFEVADVLDLGLGLTFDTVVDSGVFHVFDDQDRIRYVASLASVMRPGATCYLLCFSDRQPGTIGPRRISAAEISAAFRDGWDIRSIEADDYEACGGDLYVRGYVRAIAGAIGVDAQGLIREYDQARAHASRDADATIFDLAAVVASDGADASSGSGGSDAVGAGGQDPDETRFDLPPVREDSAATRSDIPAVRADQAEDLMAAGYEVLPAAGGAGTGPGEPAGSARPQAAAAAPGPGTRRGRRRVLVGVGAVVVLVLASVIGVRLASGSTTAKNAADSTAAQASASASGRA